MCFRLWCVCRSIPTIGSQIAAVNAGGTTTVAKGVDVNSDNSSGITPALALVEAADVVVMAIGAKTRELCLVFPHFPTKNLELSRQAPRTNLENLLTKQSQCDIGIDHTIEHEGHDAFGISLPGKKTSLLPLRFLHKSDHLPRQARDKHGKTQKRGLFMQGCKKALRNRCWQRGSQPCLS